MTELHLIDFIIVGIVVICFVFAIRTMRKRKEGCCTCNRCSGADAGTCGDCALCQHDFSEKIDKKKEM